MEYDLYILSMPAHLLPMPNLEEYLLDLLKDYQIFFFFFFLVVWVVLFFVNL